MNNEKTNNKQTNLSPQEIQAKIWALRAMAKTYKGTEAEQMYLTMAKNLEDSNNL